MVDFDLETIRVIVHLPIVRTGLKLAACALGLLVLASVVRRILGWFRRQEPVSRVDSSLTADLALLPIASVEPESTRLTVYHVPVRLAVVVIAPLGRDADPPTHSEVQQVLDHTVPGLATVLRHDQTIVRIWPRQLSAKGFAHSLARHLRLPGESGRNTPWCLVAGRTSVGSQSFSIGLALAATTANNLGLVVIESEHQWLDVLRLRPN